MFNRIKVLNLHKRLFFIHCSLLMSKLKFKYILHSNRLTLERERWIDQEEPKRKNPSPDLVWTVLVQMYNNWTEFFFLKIGLKIVKH